MNNKLTKNKPNVLYNICILHQLALRFLCISLIRYTCNLVAENLLNLGSTWCFPCFPAQQLIICWPSSIFIFACRLSSLNIKTALSTLLASYSTKSIPFLSSLYVKTICGFKTLWYSSNIRPSCDYGKRLSSLWIVEIPLYCFEILPNTRLKVPHDAQRSIWL